MDRTKRLDRYVLLAVLTICSAMASGELLAQDGGFPESIDVQKIFAIDNFGAVTGVRIVGDHLNSGNLVEVTVGDMVLELERASGTEIVAMLPAGFAPGVYEMAVSVVDEVSRVDQAVGFEIYLPTEIAGTLEKSRGLLWSIEGAEADTGDLSPLGTKALSTYRRRAFSGGSCPNDFYCWRRVGCSSSEFAVGGGLAVSGTNVTRVYVMESYPVNNRAWQARGLNETGGSRTVTTWVVCVR